MLNCMRVSNYLLQEKQQKKAGGPGQEPAAGAAKQLVAVAAKVASQKPATAAITAAPKPTVQLPPKSAAQPARKTIAPAVPKPALQTAPKVEQEEMADEDVSLEGSVLLPFFSWFSICSFRKDVVHCCPQ